MEGGGLYVLGDGESNTVRFVSCSPCAFVVFSVYYYPLKSSPISLLSSENTQTTHSFPNLLFNYGPQALTAFATGPFCAELQGQWILVLLTHMHDNHLEVFDPTHQAEEDY